MLTSLIVFVGGTIFYIFVGAIISKPLTKLAGWLWPFLGYKYPFLISKKNVQILKLFIWIISSLNFSWWPKISYVTKLKVNLMLNLLTTFLLNCFITFLAYFLGNSNHLKKCPSKPTLCDYIIVKRITGFYFKMIINFK